MLSGSGILSLEIFKANFYSAYGCSCRVCFLVLGKKGVKGNGKPNQIVIYNYYFLMFAYTCISHSCSLFFILLYAVPA